MVCHEEVHHNQKPQSYSKIISHLNNRKQSDQKVVIEVSKDIGIDDSHQTQSISNDTTTILINSEECITNLGLSSI